MLWKKCFSWIAKSKIVSIAILLTVILLFLFPVSSFYFWHDDFSTFYGPRTGQCIFDWPYLQFCPVFESLLKVFGYNPQPYFVLGIILAGFTAVMFYLFMKELVDEKTALIVSLIYSTFYIGAGVFQEAYDPIISFPSLSLLFLSSLLILRNKFIVGLSVFALSVLSFSARSGTNLLPLMALIILFVNKPVLKKLILVSLMGITFFVSFFFSPASLKGLPTSTNINILDKAKFFLQTSGSLILTDEMNLKNVDSWRIIIALGLYVICIVSIVKNRNKLLLFALFWIFSMYLPYGLRADFRLVTTHRYLVFVVPGVLMAWAAFSKYRYWLVLSLILFGMYSILNYRFLHEHLRISNLRRSFYSQLHSLVPTLAGNEALFITSPKSIQNQLNDFFRVGYTPSESAIGSEYGIVSDKLKLITDGEILSRTLPQNLLMFYYDGSKLIKTNISQYLFKKQPSLVSNIIPYSLPLITSCGSCNFTSDELITAYRYIQINRDLKRELRVDVASSGEDTVIENAIDDDESTYWIGRRQEWVVTNNLVLKLHFKTLVNLQNVNFTTNSGGHKPIGIEFKPGTASEFEIRITVTDGQDVPVINEINFVPKGFEDVNFDLVDKIINFRFLVARNGEENTALTNYLMSGIKACLQWEGGQKEFMIVPDGRVRSYTVDLPAVGPNISKFKIGCLESYPLTVSDYSN